MLSPSEDAYGAAILDYWRGVDAYEAIERDDDWIGYSAGPSGYLSKHHDWPAHQREAIGLARGRALVIGCGAGRHSLYLQEHGHDVVGIDNSPAAIEVCNERGLRNAQVMSVTQIGRELGTLDTILMLGNNFGLFGGYARGDGVYIAVIERSQGMN